MHQTKFFVPPLPPPPYSRVFNAQRLRYLSYSQQCFIAIQAKSAVIEVVSSCLVLIKKTKRCHVAKSKCFNAMAILYLFFFYTLDFTFKNSWTLNPSAQSITLDRVGHFIFATVVANGLNGNWTPFWRYLITKTQIKSFIENNVNAVF